MWNLPEDDDRNMELFLQGQCVPAGTYERIDVPMFVSLHAVGILPEGTGVKVACYILKRHNKRPDPPHDS